MKNKFKIFTLILIFCFLLTYLNVSNAIDMDLENPLSSDNQTNTALQEVSNSLTSSDNTTSNTDDLLVSNTTSEVAESTSPTVTTSTDASDDSNFLTAENVLSIFIIIIGILIILLGGAIFIKFK